VGDRRETLLAVRTCCQPLQLRGQGDRIAFDSHSFAAAGGTRVEVDRRSPHLERLSERSYAALVGGSVNRRLLDRHTQCVAMGSSNAWTPCTRRNVDPERYPEFGFRESQTFIRLSGAHLTPSELQMGG
jgi:hypothetical protein